MFDSIVQAERRMKSEFGEKMSNYYRREQKTREEFLASIYGDSSEYDDEDDEDGED